MACRIFSCSVWDRVPWPGTEPRPPALGAQSLSHWTTREVSRFSCLKKVDVVEYSQGYAAFYPIHLFHVLPLHIPTSHRATRPETREFFFFFGGEGSGGAPIHFKSNLRLFLELRTPWSCYFDSVSVLASGCDLRGGMSHVYPWELWSENSRNHDSVGQDDLAVNSAELT